MSSSTSENSPPRPDSDAAGPAATTAGPPLISVRDLGLWYRLYHQRDRNFKTILFGQRRGRQSSLLWALRHVSFDCRPGQIVGVVGRNGAGKSTLCRVLARILTPDEGSLHVRGEVSTLLALGAGFNRDLSGRANIMLYGAFLGVPRTIMTEQVQRIIDFAELEEFIDEPIRAYSSGMRSRLSFAVATSLDPEILLLDEVLAVGDREFRMKSTRRLEAMMEKSKLIIIVSHSVPFLRNICTHCLWLNRGRLVQSGEAGPVLDAYVGASGGPGPTETTAKSA